MRSLVGLLLFAVSACAVAGDYGPWTFGMSQQDVLAEKDFGPYKTFSNGDLETCSGTFAGQKRNFQFYFKDDSLWRIAIRTYEGQSIEEATAAWLSTYAALGDKFGQIETPNMVGKTPAALAAQAEGLVESEGKAQMAPKSQPSDAFVFCSFSRYDYEGTRYYTVTVNLESPQP